MRLARTWVVVCSLLFAIQSFAQQTTSTPNQGTALLQKALAALSPSTPISDVTLSGTARRIVGSDDESGPVVIKVVAGSGSRVDLTLPSGPRTEIRSVSSSAGRNGSWSGPDGVSHAISYHNLLTDPAWSPALAIASALSAANSVIAYVGPETRNSQSVIHISATQEFPSMAGQTASSMQHLTQTEFFLDSNTSLPVSITFNAHADNNALLDIPIEIDFSDYQLVSGSQIPFHVQKLLNNSLVLDLQFTSATLNSGISASTLTAGGAQ